jgi:hypothetical protein
VGRKREFKAPAEPTPKPPFRQVLTMDRVETVVRGSGGGVVIVGRRGPREIEISVEIPREEVLLLEQNPIILARILRR